MSGKTPRTSHDQNFKNLILDYPLQAIAFFSPQEAAGLDESVHITPIRQEQLKYLGVIDIYTALDDNEMQQSEQQYLQENKTMATSTEGVAGAVTVKKQFRSECS